MDLITLGRRIRHFRTSAGLTLDDVAAATGLAPSQLSLIENGKREPRISALGTLAVALGVDVPALLSTEPPSHRAALEIEDCAALTAQSQVFNESIRDYTVTIVDAFRADQWVLVETNAADYRRDAVHDFARLEHEVDVFLVQAVENDSGR